MTRYLLPVEQDLEVTIFSLELGVADLEATIQEALLSSRALMSQILATRSGGTITETEARRLHDVG